jgi:hypothetical protein
LGGVKINGSRPGWWDSDGLAEGAAGTERWTFEGLVGCLGFRSAKEHAQQREVREQARTALVAVVVY